MGEIVRLPIEYYEAKFLILNINKIGKIVNEDKNIVLQEHGKYVRLCLEVDLSKTLLVMFVIRDRVYKVEYEGLHLLCLNRGKFGH